MSGHGGTGLWSCASEPLLFAGRGLHSQPNNPAACLSLLLGQHSLPRPQQILQGHTANVTGLSFGAQGTLACSLQDMTVHIFSTTEKGNITTTPHRTDTGQGYLECPQTTLHIYSSCSVASMASSLAYSPCKSFLAIGTAQGRVELC